MEDYHFERDGVIANSQSGCMWIRIDCPKYENGLDWRGMEALCEVYEEILHGGTTHVLVVAGTGRWFYTGGRVNASDPMERERYGRSIARCMALRRQLDIPVIAAINGECRKAGMAMLLNADLAVACEEASFSFPEINTGGVPMMVMANAMGLPKKLALEAYYSGQSFDAATALRMGIVNRVVPAQKLHSAVQEYVEMLLSKPWPLIKMTRDAWYAMEAMPTWEERVAYAQKTLEEKVLPYMAAHSSDRESASPRQSAAKVKESKHDF